MSSEERPARKRHGERDSRDDRRYRRAEARVHRGGGGFGGRKGRDQDFRISLGHGAPARSDAAQLNEDGGRACYGWRRCPGASLRRVAGASAESRRWRSGVESPTPASARSSAADLGVGSTIRRGHRRVPGRCLGTVLASWPAVGVVIRWCYGGGVVHRGTVTAGALFWADAAHGDLDVAALPVRGLVQRSICSRRAAITFDGLSGFASGAARRRGDGHALRRQAVVQHLLAQVDV